jgi:deoxycytidylate deaminase
VSRTLTRGFDTALAAASLSDAPRTAKKMGSSLFSGSRLLSVGANLYARSHPASDNGKDFVLSTHAEARALVRRKHYDGDRNLTLYVARALADGSFGCSKPCANCLELCRVAGVRRVRFHDHQGNPKEIAL